ncbi:MAG: hypothetical protein ACNA78_06290 [Balneolaceae bacterium]
MNKHRLQHDHWWLIAAGALFVASFSLPSFSLLSGNILFLGYECAYIAPAIALMNDPVADHWAVEIWIRFHYLLMGLHNVMLPAAGFLYSKIKAGRLRWLAWAVVISTGNALLFLPYNALSAESSLSSLLPGYYVWTASSLIIAFWMGRALRQAPATTPLKGESE